MELEHEFTVPVPVDEAWRVLLDVERVAPCMPGATVDSVDGDDVTGHVKVKVGPITVTYRGQASFTEKDEAAGRVVIVASGRETRGSGTAAATIEARLVAEDGSTRVRVRTDLAITGRPAQFGRGVMVEVGNKILGQFAGCLEQEIHAPAAPPAPPPAAEAAPAASPTEPAPAASPTAEPVIQGPKVSSTGHQTSLDHGGAGESAGSDGGRAGIAAPPHRAARPTAEVIDLVGVAGVPVLKRLAGVAAVAGALLLLVVLARRRRR